MSTVERLAFSIAVEARGIHVLLWDDKGDLTRVLVVVLSWLHDWKVEALFLSGDPGRLEQLQDKIQVELFEQIQEGALGADAEDTDSAPQDHPIRLLFLQQGAGRSVGPRLNGWRRLLSEPNGTLLVVRNADFDEFQRAAPDLASFVGPRIYDASQLLMLCRRETVMSLIRKLPPAVDAALRLLPGVLIAPEELARWSPLCEPDES